MIWLSVYRDLFIVHFLVWKFYFKSLRFCGGDYPTALDILGGFFMGIIYMKTLIIAEKPSVARDIAEALGVGSRLENDLILVKMPPRRLSMPLMTTLLAYVVSTPMRTILRLIFPHQIPRIYAVYKVRMSWINY